MFLALFVLLIATLLLLPLVVISVYSKYRFTPEGKRRSLPRYILGVIASFYLAQAAMSVFLQSGCPEGSGNGCIFGLSLMGQPVALLVCVGVYLCLWVTVGKYHASKRTPHPWPSNR